LRYQTRERLIDFAILVGCLLVRFWVIPNYIEITEEYELASLSPAFFPVLSTWVIAGLAFLHLALGLIQKRSPIDEAEAEEWLTPREEYKAYACTLVIIAYFFAMKCVGFLISTALMLAALFVIEGVKGPLKVVITSVSVTIGVYLFFLYVMQVHFPVGVIFE